MCLEPNFAPRLSWMIGGARWRPCCQLSWCDSRFLFQLRKQIQSMQNLADCQRSCYHDVGTSSTEWLHEESSSEVPREAEGPVGICGNKTRYSGQIPQKNPTLDVRTGLQTVSMIVYESRKPLGKGVQLAIHANMPWETGSARCAIDAWPYGDLLRVGGHSRAHQVACGRRCLSPAWWNVWLREPFH